MKPHPRIRKTIKWGGAAVTVLLVVVWIASGWYSVSWRNMLDSAYELNSGCVDCWGRYRYFGGKEVRGWWTYQHPFSLNWRPGVVDNGARAAWRTPLWIPIGACFGITAAAWRRDALARRRAKLNLCPQCNYDRTGLARDTKCPECGAAPSSYLL